MFSIVFFTGYFALFMLGAILGRLMADSGSASAIAKWIVGRLGPQHSVLAIVLACAVLTYGGVSVLVVIFAAYPVAVAIFRGSNTPKRFIPAAVPLGGATFTLSGIPGTPSIQNAMPIAFFGTDTYAAHPLDAQDASPATHDPSLLVAFLPLLMVLVMNVAMTWWIIPAMDLA